MRKLNFLLLTVLLTSSLSCFTQSLDSSYVFQLSGVLSQLDNEQLHPVPYAQIYVGEEVEGFSNENGFFSIPVTNRDTIYINALGKKEYVIETEKITVDNNKATVLVEMEENAINLPKLYVYPWPSKTHFKYEFLALVPNDSIQRQINRHLERRVINDLSKGFEMDGREQGSLALKQQAASYYYLGQNKPMNILDVGAWSKFISALKNGEVFKQ